MIAGSGALSLQSVISVDVLLLRCTHLIGHLPELSSYAHPAKTADFHSQASQLRSGRLRVYGADLQLSSL